MPNYNHQVAIELLREYFKKTPKEIVQADWEAVKNLGLEGGPTVNQFLSEEHHDTPLFDKKLFEWEQSLLVQVGYDLDFATNVDEDFGKSAGKSKSQLIEEANNYHYAMAA